MHLDRGDVQRLLHGELAAAAETEAQEHLQRCSRCRNELEKARSEELALDSLLATVDHPVPQIDASTVMVEADPGPPSYWMRWAAGLVLGVAVAGAAYAAPGSPVPLWVSTLTSLVVREQEPAPDGVDDGGETVARGGLGVDPADRLVIQISGVLEGSAMRVLLTAGTDVEAMGGSASTSYTSDPGRLAVTGLGVDTIQISIPLSAPYVELRVDDRAVLVKDRASLRTGETALTGPGPFLIPLVGGAL